MEKTGRIFKCIGLQEKKFLKWSSRFEKGILYHEIKDTFFNKTKKGILLLKEKNNNNTWYVDKSQFKLQKNEKS